MSEDAVEIFPATKDLVQDKSSPEKEIFPLPFTYKKTYDHNLAEYHLRRVNRVKLRGIIKPATDEQILNEVKKEREEKDWFTYEYYREKGIPEEQTEFQINGQPITVYNWNKDKPFTDEHVQRAQRVFQELTTRFPQIMEKIRWVLIDDRSIASKLGDPEKYPLNGSAQKSWKAFELYPRGMELNPHRIAKASNFEGTFVHESTHLIQSEFEPKWGEKFQWVQCYDKPDEWELRPAPDGSKTRYFNKTTGEMAPQSKYPLQPDQCITDYAKQTMDEDICDSMVAYIYDPDLLQSVSPDKYNILQKHDAKRPRSDVAIKRIPQDEIKLPEIKPETVYYYIEEP